MSDPLDALIEAINRCNQQLYAQAEQSADQEYDDEHLWAQSSQLLEQRAKLLAQLDQSITSLNPQQINIVGQLYQSMLETDQQHIANAQEQRLKTRNSLRAIKNAEKAVPAYKAHDSKSYR